MRCSTPHLFSRCTAVLSCVLSGLLLSGLLLSGCVAHDDRSGNFHGENPDLPPGLGGSGGGGDFGGHDAGAPLCEYTLSVTCDGHEDCGSGQTCCGVWDTETSTYRAIECRERCDDEAHEYELCHPGDDCHNPDYACLPSDFLPSFLYRCLEPDAPTLPLPSTPDVIAGELSCGEIKCDSDEQCCLRPPLQPYCAPRSEPCTCGDHEPPPPMSDAAVPLPDAGIDEDGGYPMDAEVDERDAASMDGGTEDSGEGEDLPDGAVTDAGGADDGLDSATTHDADSEDAATQDAGDEDASIADAGSDTHALP